MPIGRKIRVLVVDDSALVRKLLTEALNKTADIEVIGAAMDPHVARERIIADKPDVITLDVEMPRMDGITFLSKLMEHYPLPVVVVSSLTPAHSELAMRALALGAVEVVAKPGSSFSVPDVERILARAIRTAAAARVVKRSGAELQAILNNTPLLGTVAAGITPTAAGTASPATAAAAGAKPATAAGQPSLVHGDVGGSAVALTTTHKILAIGASTGGTQAIEAVLTKLPATTPGTVIAQHMPEMFTAAFASRLNGLCAMEVREARDGDAVVPGVALIAPGGRHMVLARQGARYVVHLKDGPPVHHQKPAVDVLFHSVARQAGENAVGIVLTGMGADGADGLLAMRQAGARTAAQDEASCVVFGMPKEAIAKGGAEQVLPLPDFPKFILDTFRKMEVSI